MNFVSYFLTTYVTKSVFRFVDDMLTETASVEIMNNHTQRMLEWKRKERPAAKFYKGNCIAFHYLHFEKILEDIVAVEKVNAMFGYPDADQKGRCLESAPRYFVK